MGAAVRAWEHLLGELEGMSGGAVCAIDGLVPVIEISRAKQQASAVATRKVKALPKLSSGTWSQLIYKQVDVFCWCLQTA